MERAEILLEKLRTQLREHAGKEALSLTFRQLYDEIFQAGSSSPAAGSKRVSVVLPLHAQAPAAEPPSAPEEKIVETLLVDEAEIEAELQALKESAELINELSTKARVAPVPEDDAAEEIPTLASHLPYLPPQFNPPPPASPVAPEPEGGATLNDRFDTAAPPPLSNGQGSAQTLNDRHAQATPVPEQNPAEPSLNDRLRAAQKELADQLQEAPVRDLRKAIGINDRYLFINELFQGNEAMFERSLKTLNGFSILAEAEFWMQRELQVKLGWKDQDPLVAQFVQLIRRRFS